MLRRQITPYSKAIIRLAKPLAYRRSGQREKRDKIIDVVTYSYAYEAAAASLLESLLVFYLMPAYLRRVDLVVDRQNNYTY